MFGSEAQSLTAQFRTDYPGFICPGMTALSVPNNISMLQIKSVQVTRGQDMEEEDISVPYRLH